MFCWRTLTSWCSILWITTFCITQCTAASIRIHNNNYATAFASVGPRPIRRRKSSSSSLLSYQIEPPIEDQQQQQQRISTSSASVDDGSDNDLLVDTGVSPEISFPDEQQQQQLTENTTESVEDNNWISATRTLGSLILHLKDETRDSNVDVFGRPLLNSNNNNNNNNLIDQFGLPRENQSTTAAESSSEEGEGGSSNTSVTGFTTQFPNSLASYLLKLKRDEEDNRERIIFEEENRNRRGVTKRDGSVGGGNNDAEGNDKLPISLQLDQVSSLLSFPDPITCE